MVMHGERQARRAQLAIAAAAAMAAVTDVAGALSLLPRGWPVASYVVIALVLTAGSLHVLLRMLLRRRGERVHGNGRTLLALGLLLIAWRLRGHFEIPPDLPLVAAELLAALVLALAAYRRSLTR